MRVLRGRNLEPLEDGLLAERVDKRRPTESRLTGDLRTKVDEYRSSQPSN